MSKEEIHFHTLLTDEDIERIDSTKLSAADKHYLRLLAHCLETFRSISHGSLEGVLPTQEKRKKWLMDQYSLQDQESFLIAFMEQLDVAGIQIEKIATHNGISPLEINLSHLISSLESIQEPF